MLPHLAHQVFRRQAGERVIGDDGAPFIERAEIGIELRAADVIEHQADAASAGQGAGANDDVLVAIEDHLVGTHLARVGGLFRRTDGSDHLHPGEFCKLDEGRADASGRANDESRVGRRAGAAIVEQRPGDLIIGQANGVLERDVFG